MVGSWRTLLLRWLFGFACMFAGSYLLFGLRNGSYDVGQAICFGAALSTLTLLPAVLTKLAPIRSDGEKDGSVGSRNTSWLVYACLLEAVAGMVVAAMPIPWGWRLLGVATAIMGVILAYALRKGRLRISIRP